MVDLLCEFADFWKKQFVVVLLKERDVAIWVQNGPIDIPLFFFVIFQISLLFYSLSQPRPKILNGFLQARLVEGRVSI
jgi:hypothetical protein